MSTAQPTLASLSIDLATGRTTAAELTAACIAAIDAPDGQGTVAFTLVDRAGSMAAALEADIRRQAGRPLSPFDGIPLSIKDLFNVKGQATKAGSVVLGDDPAESDAPSVSRLREAGFVLIGRTNMSEFAFSGLGINPHYGTPRAPWERKDGHVSGGSTSGGAVSVTDGMAHGALGTDTGGSCRIPAAFCNIVGFKPTADTVPRDGAIPLSLTLDSVGSMGRSVSCCATLHQILSGTTENLNDTVHLADMRFGVPTNFVLNGMDDYVAHSFRRALDILSAQGAEIVELTLPAFDRIPEINAKGGFPATESYAWHRDLIVSRRDAYDQKILSRIIRGAEQSESDVIELRKKRDLYIDDVSSVVKSFDAILFPTVPIVPPRIDEIDSDERFTALNIFVLRNSTTINLLDGCAISLPVGRVGEPPVGLTIASTHGRDAHLLAVASAAERAFVKANGSSPLPA